MKYCSRTYRRGPRLSPVLASFLIAGLLSITESPTSAADIGTESGADAGTESGADTEVGTGADTTELIPELPPLQQVDGSAGSLLNRGLGTGDQLFCSEVGAEILRITTQWAYAVDANADALADNDAEAAEKARLLANTLRIAYTNANAANAACLTAANAALTSSPEGSFAL